MKLPLIHLVWKTENHRAFIDYWIKIYQKAKANNEDYDRLIKKRRYSPDDIRQLFNLKNGMAINRHHTKYVAVRRILQNLKQVNDMKRQFDRAKFDSAFGKMAPIWQIFL